MKDIARFFWYPLPLFLGLLFLFQAFTFLFFTTAHLYFMVSCVSFGCGPTLLGTWFLFPLTLTGLSYPSIRSTLIPFISGAGEWLQTAHAVFVLTLYLGLYEVFDFYRALFA